MVKFMHLQETELEKSTRPLAMVRASCCRTSRNFDCFQCKLLNLPIHMVMSTGLVEILRIYLSLD